MANKCLHNKRGFSGYKLGHSQNSTFMWHCCGGKGNTFCKRPERDRNAHLWPEGWVYKIDKHLTNSQCNIIVRRVRSSESIEFSRQNLVKVAKFIFLDMLYGN